MEKETFYIQDATRIESTEPLIIFALHIGSEVLSMPELTDLIEKYYFFN
jgi:hypothetical protein